jgi:hypothetical protein
MTPHELAYLASSRAHEDLVRLNAQFIENFVTRDVARHDALLHPRFTAIQSNGARLDRAAYLARWATAFDPAVIIHWDTRDERIDIIGPVGLVRATNKHIIRHAGRDEVAMTTYIDTYLYESGRWWCIQAQSTPVAAGAEPGNDTMISLYIEGQQVR